MRQLKGTDHFYIKKTKKKNVNKPAYVVFLHTDVTRLGLLHTKISKNIMSLFCCFFLFACCFGVFFVLFNFFFFSFHGELYITVFPIDIIVK